METHSSLYVELQTKLGEQIQQLAEKAQKLEAAPSNLKRAITTGIDPD